MGTDRIGEVRGLGEADEGADPDRGVAFDRRQLSSPWRHAFSEAWASYCDGDLGIGAVLADPISGEVVAAGRNRVNNAAAEPRRISGNFMAHAEMNAIAALNRSKADGLDLYTTLQPCLMCAATAVFMHVDQVLFAASDEYFADIDELWQHHPYSRRNKPRQNGPLDQPLSTFARLLPLVVQCRQAPDGPVMELADRELPKVAALARSTVVAEALDRVCSARGTVDQAMDAVTPFLDF